MRFLLDNQPGFSLAAAAAFAEDFPGTDATAEADQLSFAWPLDGDWRVARVSLHATEASVVGEVETEDEEIAQLARRDVERILSLDVDGAGFTAVGERDTVVAEAQARFPGLRPVLFFSPYEAAVWTILGQRVSRRQATAAKQRIAEQLGTRGAFPAPAQLADVDDSIRGVNDLKAQRLRALAEAADDGLLTRDRLRAMDYEDALTDLQRLPGIGPFAAQLIMIRGVGAPDAMPTVEQRILAIVADRYDGADVDTVSDVWRPYRSWVALLLRAAAEE